MPVVKVGDPIPLQLQLPDGDTDKFVQVHLHDSGGTPLGGSPVALPHDSEGSYEDLSTVLMPDTAEVVGTFEVYKDAGFTQKSAVYCDASELYQKDIQIDKICDIQANINILIAGAGPGDLEGILIDEDGPLEGILEDCGDN